MDIKEFQPVKGIAVRIKTNWTSYIAKLEVSPFCGNQFRVINSGHVVQLTTVTDWQFASECTAST